MEYKNPKILIKYIKHIFKKIHIREQFLLIYFIHNFIKTKLVRLIFNRFKVKGFYLKVKGKISAGGNDRKKIYYIKKWQYSPTYLKLKLNKAYFQTTPLNGAVGINLILAY